MHTLTMKIEEVPVDEVIKRVESELYKYVMELSRFNQSEAAKELKVSRGTLRTKLNIYYPGKYFKN